MTDLLCERNDLRSRLDTINTRITDLGYYDFEGFVRVFELNIKRLERVNEHCQCSPMCYDMESAGEGRDA